MPAPQGLQTTLFERVHGLYGASVASLLTVQYRMHADIMTWASEELYGGALTAHDSVAARLLQDLEVTACIKGFRACGSARASRRHVMFML